MKLLLTTILLSVSLTLPAHSQAFNLTFDPWSKQDIALQTLYTGLHIIDWGNTLYIADNPYKFYETNPILGNHPSRGNVNLYFAGTLAASFLVTHILPKEYRPYFQTIIISLETAVMASNHSLGVGMRF